MMKRLVTLAVSGTVAVALCACSGGSGGSSGLVTGNGGGEGSAQISGTLGGETFGVRSGLGHFGTDGSIDIILSDAGQLCDAVTRQKFRPGETVLQAYRLVGSAPGKFTTDEIKYASVASTCPSGQPIAGTLIAKKGRATKSDFTLSTVTSSAVAGNLTVTFDDGSSISGSFSVPVCPTSQAENATCN
jgi:hypothetical protein